MQREFTRPHPAKAKNFQMPLIVRLANTQIFNRTGYSKKASCLSIHVTQLGLRVAVVISNIITKEGVVKYPNFITVISPSHLANSFRGNHWRTVFAFPVFPIPDWESLPKSVGNEQDVVDTLLMDNLHKCSPFSCSLLSFPNSVPPWWRRLGSFSKLRQQQQCGNQEKLSPYF